MTPGSAWVSTVALCCLAVVVACDAGPASAPVRRPVEVTTPSLASRSTTPLVTATSTPPDDRPAIDPDSPVPDHALAVAPLGLGPRFETADDPLPARTTGALHDAGGQALAVDTALNTFGIFDIPRPSGAHSAVMELNVTATGLGGAPGTSLSVEVLYMVASPRPIEELLVDAAAMLAATGPHGPSTVPDYDGTTGDPRCARLAVDAGDGAAVSVEGCEYRADPLTAVRSIAFRRLNLLVAGPPTLPAVFDQVPAELLAAGELAGYAGTFGRPAGPAGHTVQLRVEVHLSGPLVELGDGWQADGPGRWWRDDATVVVDAGTAIWQRSTRAEP